MSEDAKLLKTSRTMAEPGLVDSTSQCAGAMQQFLAAKNMAMFLHPPYSPDLPACGIFFCE